MVRAGVDSARAGIEGGEPGHANSSLPTADCRLPTVLRYIERNPLRAGLAGRAEEWRWVSLRRPAAPTGAPVRLESRDGIPAGALAAVGAKFAISAGHKIRRTRAEAPAFLPVLERNGDHKYARYRGAPARQGFDLAQQPSRKGSAYKRSEPCLSLPPRGKIALIAGQARINFLDPGDDSALEVLQTVEPGRLKQGNCLGASSPTLAVHDD
jgi:hypothetical protein